MAPVQLIKEHGRLRTGDSDFTVTDSRPDGLVILKVLCEQIYDPTHVMWTQP